MDLPSPPSCDSHGWFQPVIQPLPPSWPWALPHLYAVNVASDPGWATTRASAKRDGSVELSNRVVSDRSRFEVIGFWRGAFGLVHWERTMTRKRADDEAQSTFASIPVRYLMHSGQVIRENSTVLVTGSWPSQWSIDSLSDLGAFCAFIYDEAKEHGAQDEAKIFRQSIRFAWPPTEQLLVYIAALESAEAALSPWLTPSNRRHLAEVVLRARTWLQERRNWVD